MADHNSRHITKIHPINVPLCSMLPWYTLSVDHHCSCMICEYIHTVSTILEGCPMWENLTLVLHATMTVYPSGIYGHHAIFEVLSQFSH